MSRDGGGASQRKRRLSQDGDGKKRVQRRTGPVRSLCLNSTRVVASEGRRSCTQTPQAVSARALTRPVSRTAKGLREGQCQDPTPCLESSPCEQGAELGSRGVRGRANWWKAQILGDCDQGLARRSGRSPLGSGRGHPATGRVVKEERTGGGMPRKRSSGRHGGPAPRGGRGGPCG